jgi:hypothetical protein
MDVALCNTLDHGSGVNKMSVAGSGSEGRGLEDEAFHSSLQALRHLEGSLFFSFFKNLGRTLFHTFYRIARRLPNGYS